MKMRAQVHYATDKDTQVMFFYTNNNNEVRIEGTPIFYLPCKSFDHALDICKAYNGE